MSTFSVKLPSGASWTPTFVQSIDEDKCIGCGRCFRAMGESSTGWTAW